MPYAQINGIRLHYEVEGHGPPLLFIAGLGQPAIAWDPELIRTLARSYQIITYDNRGTGLSDKPDELYSIALFASEMNTGKPAAKRASQSLNHNRRESLL